MNAFERVIKRACDFIFALIALLIFWPVMVIIAILIKREDPSGDVIFRQVRIGYKGKPFTLYKFRSMRMDAEKDNRPQLYSDGDSRLTRVGAFIRAHHLDEFPQLWNVLKGEMSFVLCTPLCCTPRTLLLRYSVQWLYRHDREDA